MSKILLGAPLEPFRYIVHNRNCGTLDLILKSKITTRVHSAIDLVGKGPCFLPDFQIFESFCKSHTHYPLPVTRYPLPVTSPDFIQTPRIGIILKILSILPRSLLSELYRSPSRKPLILPCRAAEIPAGCLARSHAPMLSKTHLPFAFLRLRARPVFT